MFFPFTSRFCSSKDYSGGKSFRTPQILHYESLFKIQEHKILIWWLTIDDSFKNSLLFVNFDTDNVENCQEFSFVSFSCKQ